MRTSVESVKAGVSQGTDDMRELVKVTNMFSGLFDDVNADEVNDRNKYVESLLIQKLDSKASQLSDLSAYVSLRSSQLSQYTYSDPARGIELEMLASFRKHYKLRHGFVLTPKGSDYNKKLAVSGIPQAVLLDKQGVIRMIKVGSGPKNAHDLEKAIEKLLAEDTKPVDSEKKKETATAGSSQ